MTKLRFFFEQTENHWICKVLECTVESVLIFLFQGNRGVIDYTVCSWSFKAWLFVTVGLSCNNNFSKHRLCL